MEEETKHERFNLFLSENALTTFYRRADWAPDGSFCLIPCAQFKYKVDEKAKLCVLAFKTNDFKRPCFAIPTFKKPAVCVKFC